MVESEDEFNELCSKLLKRVKKNKQSEGQNISKASTAARSKLKRPKPSGSKKQAHNGGSKEAEQKIKAEHGPERPNDSDRTERSSAVLTQVNNGHIEKDGGQAECQEETTKPLDQLSVKNLVLENMQRFKRAAPSRMKLGSTEVHGAPVESSEALDTDGALAMALQMDIKEQPVSLEDDGLFFCQLCQKDLTAMNSALRGQHVNRCLDQDESLGGSAVAPTVPSCPLCGKPFNTERSRASHLKRCAAKLEVPAQTLLQAVQRQAAQTVTEVPPRVARVKRKGVPKQKEPSKKRKMAQTGAEVENLLVAMALSRSMQEENTEPNTVSARPPREIPPPEKKSRRKRKDKPTPLLLLQAPEEAVQKLQKRMSMLLTEEPEEKNIIALPPSHFWSMEEEEWDTWSLRGGKRCVLWDISDMMEKRETLSYYTAELNPPITPWNPLSKKLLSSQPCGVTTTSTPGASQSQTPADKDHHLATPCEDNNPPTDSQNDKQALLDLAELAGEGMTLTQWNFGAGSASDCTGRESPVSITPSGFIPSQEEENRKQSQDPCTKNPLVALAADFMEMVNNPHLSDAQVQTDCGEVLNVHMFVLYARCPLLVEAVHTEAFWVDEGSTGRVRRLLLNDVSAEAALSFLRFLYSAVAAIPSHCLPHVCELARRFGVKSLIEICEPLVCELHNPEAPVTTEDEGDDGGERAETFQELLKSMWLDEGEDLLTDQEAEELVEEMESLDGGGVGEGELEEIYEFAATQRRMLTDRDTEGGSSSEHEGEHQGKESDDSSFAESNHGVGRRKEISDAVNQHSPGRHIGTSVINTSPLKVSPAQKDVKCSPLGKSPACLNSNSLESSPTVFPLPSPARLEIQPTSASSTSPVQSPSRFIAPAASLARRLFTNDLANPSAALEEHTVPVVHTISLISPSRDEDPEGDFFDQQSLPPLDDSYDRMFSETCGEYVEPSGICESESRIHQTCPQDQKPILTSSPSDKSCPTLPELESSPNIQPQTRSFLESSSYSMVEHGKSILSSFKDSHHTAPTQNPSSKAATSPRPLTQESDIILILSSDEETESSTQAATVPVNGQNNTPGTFKGIKESPISFSGRKSSEGFSRLEMSSSSETSWLVPATPLPNSTGLLVSQLQTSHVSRSPQKPLQTSHVSRSPQKPLQTSHVSRSLQNSLQTSHVSRSLQNSLQTSHVSRSLQNSLQTSHVSRSPQKPLQTSHVSRSPQKPLQTSHVSRSPQKPLQTSHVSRSLQNSLQTSHVSRSPQNSLQTSHVSRSPQKLLQTSHVSRSPQKSLQTSHVSRSPQKPLQTSHVSWSPQKPLQTSHVSRSLQNSLQTSHVSRSLQNSLQTSHVSRSPQKPLQTSHVSRSPQKPLQTSHVSRSPQKPLQTSHVSRSPQKPLQTSHVSRSPQKPLQTSHVSRSPQKSPQTSHVSQSPQKSSQTSHVSRSPQESPQTSHVSRSPQESPQTSHVSRSPQESPQTSHVSRSPQESPQTSHVSRSPQESPQTSHVSRSPQESPQTSHVSRSPQESPQTSHVSRSPQESPQTSHVSRSPQESPQTSHVSRSPQESPQTSHVFRSPQESPQTSHVSRSPEESPQTSHVSRSPQKSSQTSHLPRSPRTSQTCSQNVSHQSFVYPSQTSSLSLPLPSPKSPKRSLIFNQSSCSNITVKPHKALSGVASKEPSSPLMSIASSTVFEVEDSEDEGSVPDPQADTSGCIFQMDYDEPPIHMEDLWSNMQETPTRPYSSPERNTPLTLNETPTKPADSQCSSTSLKRNREPASHLESPCTAASQSSRLSYLNSKLWDEWEEEEPELPAVLPLSQRLDKLPEVQKELRTPASIVRRRELAPKVPITPLPDYSDMDTPVLKKELNRFGVRALPKKKMVLKLKEIFSYTHQVMSSDSEEDVPPSQPHRRGHSSVAQAQQQPAPRKTRPAATTKASSSSVRGKKVTSVCTAKETDAGDDQPLTASQESTTSSVAASDTSSLSHSSNANEFETAFADEDDDESVPASQAASKEALTAEAMRRFIEERPELHKRILLYQPLELAALHAELKQSGIKVAAGKLLDFLDAHCVTFTTATARKEKKSRGKRKAGKRY